MHYKHVLLVDDDCEEHEIFFSAIRRVSATVDCIALDDATSALKKLVAKDINPDIIFLDLNMPVLHGQEFLREVKKHDALKNIPVIIFSTASHSSTIQRTKELGAYDFITKPGKFDDLVQVLTPFFSTEKQNAL